MTEVEITNEQIEQRIREIVDMAKEFRESMGFKSGYTDFPSNAMLIKPNGKIETINIYFRDHDIRRADMETIRKIAEDKYAVAVLLVDDRRTISFDEMAKAL